MQLDFVYVVMGNLYAIFSGDVQQKFEIAKQILLCVNCVCSSICSYLFFIDLVSKRCISKSNIIKYLNFSGPYNIIAKNK